MPVKRSTKTTKKPSRVKRSVIKRRMNGETIRQIAAHEDMTADAVQSILTLPDVQQNILRTLGLILQHADRMAERYVKLAMGESKKGSWRAIAAIFSAIGVFTTKGEVGLIAVKPERTYEHTLYEFVQKYHRKPKDLGELLKLEETLDIQPITIQNRDAHCLLDAA